MNQKILSVGLLVNLTIAGTPIPADAGVWLRSGNPNGTPIARDGNRLQTNPDRPIRTKIIRQICVLPDGVTLVCPR